MGDVVYFSIPEGLYCNPDIVVTNIHPKVHKVSHIKRPPPPHLKVLYELQRVDYLGTESILSIKILNLKKIANFQF